MMKHILIGICHLHVTLTQVERARQVRGRDKVTRRSAEGGGRFIGTRVCTYAVDVSDRVKETEREEI